MPDVLARKCSIADCKTPPILSEEIHPRDPVEYTYRTGPGDLILPYGEGMVEDLNAAALVAGWHWDGSEWKCRDCKENEWAVQNQLIEILAHSMNL